MGPPRDEGEPLRVLIAGWLNSPHVIAWADSVAALGHEVHLAGRVPPGPAGIEGANIYELPGDGPLLIRSLRMSRALAEVARRVQPDLVHAHWLPEFGWMAAREGLHPLICSAWGSDVFGSRGIGRRRSKRALDGSALVTADSMHLARATRELAGRNVPIEVVRWGLDLERFAPGSISAAREALGLDIDGPLVVSVRGFKPVYNVDLQLRAFARFKRERHGARLLLKSPGDSVSTAMRETIKQLSFSEAVTIVGDLPPERMPDIYRAADVVISVPSSDSSPRSVWEALACGRPVVVSDLPWARDELEDGRHALLAPLDATAIADAIERAFGDDQLGHEGRDLARAELDPGLCAQRIEMLYRSVVETAS
jgi:glycosyltransferase involved in cell wall biosynthesis